MRFAPFAIAAALLAATAPARAASLYITTGTGSDTATISDGNPLSWSFTANPPNTSFQAGVFALQMAAGTNFGIRMELYNVTDFAFVTDVTLTNEELGLAGVNATGYTQVVFHMPVALGGANIYSVTLSVADNPLEVVDTGSFSVRGALNDLQFVEADSAEEVAVASTPAIVATPEPAAALVLGTALLGLAGARRRMAGA